MTDQESWERGCWELVRAMHLSGKLQQSFNFCHCIVQNTQTYYIANRSQETRFSEVKKGGIFNGEGGMCAKTQICLILL
jgi:hypothetical protein